jgi:hypothetical protein
MTRQLAHTGNGAGVGAGPCGRPRRRPPTGCRISRESLPALVVTLREADAADRATQDGAAAPPADGDIGPGPPGRRVCCGRTQSSGTCSGAVNSKIRGPDYLPYVAGRST